MVDNDMAQDHGLPGLWWLSPIVVFAYATMPSF